MPFQFKSRPKIPQPSQQQLESKTNSVESSSGGSKPATANVVDEPADANLVVVRNLDGECRVIHGINGATIVVEDLAHSRLAFPFVANAVQLRRVHNSTLVFLPVNTSILLDACADITLIAGAQQLRAHASTRVQLHVHADTAVIIEECSAVRMAPYRLDTESRGLLSNRSEDYTPDSDFWSKCAAPRDFDCVVGTSPNWSCLDESQWKTFSAVNI